MKISALYLYPIKSCGSISVTEAVVESRGLRHDRRFMLVSPSGMFMTQRHHHHMALIDVAIDHIDQPNATLRVWHRHAPNNVLTLPLNPEPTGETMPVSIWDSANVAAQPVSDAADRWFSDALQTTCRLVYMPESTHRAVDPTYARHNDAVSFADGYPYLLIGEASLNDLNARLPQPVEMLRFRPNIVVCGSAPYDEDAWAQFSVDGLTFYGVKPCARCVLTTVDPATGQKGPEPLKTLTTFRRWKHKILFGQNVLPAPNTNGTLRVGASVEVAERSEPYLAAPTLSAID